MSDAIFEAYYKHLLNTNIIGRTYRKFYLYPRIAKSFSGSVLDVGCGIGDFLACYPHSTGVDINPFSVKHCADRGLQAKVMDVDIIPFPDKSFDGLLLDNVLEHIENPQKLLKEMVRVLHDNGTAIIGVPGAKGFKADDDHKIYYDANRLMSMGQQFALKPIKNIYMPMRSVWLSNNVNLYCLYSVFQKKSI